MTCRRVQFELGHELKMRPKNVFSHVEVASVKTMFNAPNSYMETIMLGNIPIAIIGMIHLWDGVAEAWTVTSEEVKLYPISFHKSVLSSLVHHEKLLGIHRTQMNVRADYEDGRKWAEALGFKEEGVMLKYGPDGKDFWRYARTF